MHALLTFKVSQESLEILRECFTDLTYLPPSSSNRLQQIHETLDNAEVFITTASVLAALNAKHVPGAALKIIQVGSAGVDAAFRADWVKALVDSGRVAENGEGWGDREDGSESFLLWFQIL